jgi:hypothetical protein
VTGTGPAYQPVFSGAGTDAVVCGGVRSMLTSLTVPTPVLPALSTAETLADWFAPSLDSTVSAGQSLARPEPVSLQVQ